MRPDRWTWGKPVPHKDLRAACAACMTPQQTKAMRGNPVSTVAIFLNKYMPQRLAHEINRQRGLDFDAADIGVTWNETAAAQTSPV